MALKVNSVFMTGVNSALKTAFYPSYSFSKAKFGPSDTLKVPHEDDYSAKQRGKIHDKFVDKLIGNAKWNMPHTSMLMNQLVTYLVEHRLTPIASQYPVYDGETRMGTKVDLVCKTVDGKYVLFENKVGYESCLHRHTGKQMLAPFEHMNDSPMNQMHLYLAFSVYLFKKQYPSRVVDESQCAILRASPNGFDVFVMKQDLRVGEAMEKLGTLKDLHKRDRQRLNRNARRRKT